MTIKVKDLADANFLTELANILNRGNQAEVKRERDTIVLVEQKRKALVKTPIQD